MLSHLSLLPLPECIIVVCDFEDGRLSLQISRFDTILEDKILSTSDIPVHFFNKRSAVEKYLGFVYKVGTSLNYRSDPWIDTGNDITHHFIRN